MDRLDALERGPVVLGHAPGDRLLDGRALANALPGSTLRDLFAAFMVFVAVRLVRDTRRG